MIILRHERQKLKIEQKFSCFLFYLEKGVMRVDYSYTKAKREANKRYQTLQQITIIKII